jgi:hypothetical protein
VDDAPSGGARFMVEVPGGVLLDSPAAPVSHRITEATWPES